MIVAIAWLSQKGVVGRASVGRHVQKWGRLDSRKEIGRLIVQCILKCVRVQEGLDELKNKSNAWD